MHLPLEMFRVKASQADTVDFTKRPVFLVDIRLRKAGRFCAEKGKSEKG